MAHLKTVNKKIVEKYPFLELVKGNGYFYFVARGGELAYGTEHKALGSLEYTTVPVHKISDLSLEQWITEADHIYNWMVKASEELREKIELKEKMKDLGTEYFVKYYEKDGTIKTREFKAITDKEAMETKNRFDDLKSELYKRIA